MALLKQKSMEGVQEALVPNTGRGGAASSSSEDLVSSRLGGLKFLTQAVGRRYNSSGNTFVGQVNLLNMLCPL